MAAPAYDACRAKLPVQRGLALCDCRRRFEPHPKRDGAPRRYSAEHSAGVVCPRGYVSVSVEFKLVVVRRAEHARSGESAAYFKGLYGGHRQHRLGQIRVEPVEHGVSEPRGQAVYDASNHPADAVALRLCLLDKFHNFCRRVRVGAARRSRLDLLERRQPRRRGHGNGVHALDPRANHHRPLKPGLENLARKYARNHPAYRLARGAAAAAARVAPPEFGVVGKIRVRRTPKFGYFRVVRRPLVGVAHKRAYRSAESPALKHARQNLAFVLFRALRGNCALPGSAARQFRLNVAFRNLEPGRAAVYDTADRRSVAFAEGRHPEKSSECVSHFRLNENINAAAFSSF